ncbi:MAG: hypothetical protein NZ954_05430 [Thermofilaceae archaeon]|nr:hypothetical protein [Thermofilaceae archaeon]MCX8180991.1 hypothetical protein [Thermofilaceae archaeon]MDW8004096.1 hypothetical protein [Thermofilaceae archaeon]
MIYACVRALGDFEECEVLCEPVDGWIWVRCEDVGALMRTLARLISKGRDPGYVYTVKGEAVDVFELDKADLSGLLDGEVLFTCKDPTRAIMKLIKLGAKRATYREGVLVAVLNNVQIEEVLREGIVPVVWRKKGSEREGAHNISRLLR